MTIKLLLLIIIVILTLINSCFSILDHLNYQRLEKKVKVLERKTIKKGI